MLPLSGTEMLTKIGCCFCSNFQCTYILKNVFEVRSDECHFIDTADDSSCNVTFHVYSEFKIGTTDSSQLQLS